MQHGEQHDKIPRDHGADDEPGGGRGQKPIAPPDAALPLADHAGGHAKTRAAQDGDGYQLPHLMQQRRDGGVKDAAEGEQKEDRDKVTIDQGLAGAEVKPQGQQ